MKHFVSSIQENMHGLLEHMFVDYANLLRSKYPNKTIRNAAVFTSGVPEFARFGYIELIDARKGHTRRDPRFSCPHHQTFKASADLDARSQLS
jgi:hypothetical protein